PCVGRRPRASGASRSSARTGARPPLIPPPPWPRAGHDPRTDGDHVRRGLVAPSGAGLPLPLHLRPLFPCPAKGGIAPVRLPPRLHAHPAPRPPDPLPRARPAPDRPFRRRPRHRLPCRGPPPARAAGHAPRPRHRLRRGTPGVGRAHDPLLVLAEREPLPD